MRNIFHDGDVIVYITPRDDRQNAVSINTKRRKRLLETIGYTVKHIQCDNRELMKVCATVWTQRHVIRQVIIRIDGSGILDKYTLVKLLVPGIPVIWEIHGIPQELLSFSRELSVRIDVWKNTLKRSVLSLLVDGCICVSKELLSHIKRTLVVRASIVIPNFLFLDEIAFNSQKHATALSANFIRRDAFVVLWGGDPRLPWHALDDMARAAELVWKEDKTILFVFVGSDHYYSPSQSPNTLYLSAVPHSQFLALVRNANVCLAMYKRFLSLPMYFSPVKFLEYLGMGKPVIGSRAVSGHLIRHGENGYLVEGSNDAARKILYLKRHKSAYKRLSQNALRTANQNVFESSATNLYRQFLSRWNNRP